MMSLTLEQVKQDLISVSQIEVMTRRKETVPPSTHERITQD